MKIIAYHISRQAIFNSLGEKCASDFLSFLMKDYSESIKCFDQLDYCVACLCYLINITPYEAHILQTTGFVGLKNGYRIGYRPGKYASVAFGDRDNRTTVKFSDVAQYDAAFDEPSYY